MADTRVATRYAHALFAVASSSGVVESVADDLDAIATATRSNAQFRDVLLNPSINREDRMKLMDAVFSDRVTALTMQLLRLLIEKRREPLIHDLNAEYQRIRRESGNIAFAQVASSRELTPDQRTSIVRKLESSTGKKVEAEFVIEPDLIGGVRTTIGNYVLDGSVKGSLQRLRDRLTYDVLKQI